MAETENNRIVNIREYFSPLNGEDFTSYSQQVHHKLSHLLRKEIFNRTYDNVIILGRKGMCLFQPCIQKINNFQRISVIQLFTHTQHPLIKTIFPSGSDNGNSVNPADKTHPSSNGIVLLTDAINTGHEVNEVILACSGKISKVCGYLACDKGLSYLQTKYPNIQFSFTVVVDNNEYMNEQCRLQLIYNGRLIPLDGDHPYFIYDLKNKIDINYLKDCMISIFKDLLNAENPIKKDDLAIPDVYSYTMNIDYGQLCRKFPSIISNAVEVDRVQVRFKLDSAHSKFRIMALALDTVVNESVEGGKDNIIEYDKCDLNIITNRLCEGLTTPTPLVDNLSKKVCPLCIDINISEFILKYAEKELLSLLNNAGIQISEVLM